MSMSMHAYVRPGGQFHNILNMLSIYYDFAIFGAREGVNLGITFLLSSLERQNSVSNEKFFAPDNPASVLLG